MEPIPTTIGRYMVENLVGIGGMGQIYKAHDPDIGRPVAIKLISTKLMSGVDRADYLRRFRREAQAAARCVHPNIVTIYDFALHEGQPFIAMEFVYGASLRQALDIAPVMATSDAIRIMLQVLDALASAHGAGHYPSRHQAGERHADLGKAGEGDGLWHLPLRQYRGHERLLVNGHAKLHVAGAVPGRPSGRPLRHIFGRSDAV